MNDAMVDPKEIFLDALECRSPEELSRFLDDACAGDSAVRARVDSLMRAHRRAGGFLSGSAADDVVHEDVGSVIGPYRLVKQIGEGGMGVVFKAEQTQPVERLVAVKIIKPGMDSRQVIARFAAERQALALMDHPHIARVLDAGTTDTGRPYFVMELVAGIPITEFCDQGHLSVEQRLKLMAAVCQAVQHAHQKGVIHRDIKPSNVLVAEDDGKPVPKIIDFGVAKATAQRLTEKTAFTQHGQIVGTFEYMSPEQACFSDVDVDTRSDIYSLGVLLYELLAGSTPFDKQRLQRSAFDEMLRIIREEEPPRPSTRLDSSESLPSIAANRHLEPARLSRLMRGDLDWIVMKALEKDRNRRYEAASALAADIMHYLSDEPVTAAAPSRLYRATKLIKRNKAAVIALAAVLASLIVGMIGMTIGLVSQSQQRAIAERERAEAQLNLAAALQSQDNFAEAEKLYRQALTTGSSEMPENRQRAARTLLRLAATVRQRGDAGESERLYREAIAAQRAAFPLRDPSIAHALMEFGLILRNEGRRAEAEPLIREAYEIRRHAVPADHRATGICALYLGSELLLVDRFAEAEPLLRESIAEYQKVVPPDEWRAALTRVELGRDLMALGRPKEAETELLSAARALEATNDYPYACSALGAFYAAWEQKEPGNGHDAKARQWFLKSVESYIRPLPEVDKPAGRPPALNDARKQPE